MVAYGFVCFISPEISHLFAPALSAHVAIETYVMIQTNLSTNDSLLRNLCRQSRKCNWCVTLQQKWS
jgi:hypothetical protein